MTILGGGFHYFHCYGCGWLVLGLGVAIFRHGSGRLGSPLVGFPILRRLAFVAKAV